MWSYQRFLSLLPHFAVMIVQMKNALIYILRLTSETPRYRARNSLPDTYVVPSLTNSNRSFFYLFIYLRIDNQVMHYVLEKLSSFIILESTKSETIIHFNRKHRLAHIDIIYVKT